jgi:hypothetical protein
VRSALAALAVLGVGLLLVSFVFGVLLLRL